MEQLFHVSLSFRLDEKGRARRLPCDVAVFDRCLWGGDEETRTLDFFFLDFFSVCVFVNLVMGVAHGHSFLDSYYL